MLKSKGNIKKGAFFSLIMISIFILIPQGVMANLVVCFEEDGHINIETAHYGECCSYVKASLPESHSFSSILEKSISKHRCHRCRDIGISNNNLEQNIVLVQTKTKLIKTLLLAALTCQISQYTEIAAEGLLPSPPHASNSILACLDSIVLLI